MAINLITGYDLNRTPHEYKKWGNAVKYNRTKYQSGNNLPIFDNSNINITLK